MIKGRSRVVADPLTTVAALQDALEAFLVKERSRDLSYLLKPLAEHTTWKAAPRPGCMARYAFLFGKLAEVCPNGVLPSKKLAKAVQALDAQYSQQFATHQGELLRAAFAKFRECRLYQEVRRRTLAKAIADHRSKTPWQSVPYNQDDMKS